MFGRKRRDADGDEAEAPLDAQLAADSDADLGPDEVDAAPAAPARTHGPWDAGEVPAAGPQRVDLGGLHVPVVEGVEVRIDVDQESGQVVSATLVTPESLIQVLAFAAPRTSGIWGEVRAEIVASVRSSGGRAEVVEGAWGPEVVADVPTDVAGQLAPARFIGVDGPRWFLRGLVQGRAANTPSAEPVLLQAFSDIVVIRGDEAMAVRDQIALRLPKEAVAAAEAAEAEAAAQAGTPGENADGGTRPGLPVPERGPEITETR